MNKQQMIDEYWELERKLKSLAKSTGLSVRGLYKKLSLESEEVQDAARPILVRQIELLEHFQQWEYDNAGNVVVLALRRRQKAG